MLARVLLVLALFAPSAAADPTALSDSLDPVADAASTPLPPCGPDPVVCAIEGLPIDPEAKATMLAAYFFARELVCLDEGEGSVGTGAATGGCWYVVERGRLHPPPALP